MHANTIRVYTILMPEFYEALAEYNARAEEPLYFIQGVYNNEEDISNISDAYGEDGKIANDWIEMCKTIVDVVHGNAVIEPVPGNASGTYTSDVSQYLMGWILGRNHLGKRGGCADTACKRSVFGGKACA